MLSWHDISFRPRIKLQSVEVAREVLASNAEVLRVRHAFLPHERRAGTRDEPLRTSAWEVREVPKQARSQVLSPTLSWDGKERTLGTGLVP